MEPLRNIQFPTSNYLMFPGLEKPETMDSILNSVCKLHGVSSDSVLAGIRKREIVQARRAAAYLINKKFNKAGKKNLVTITDIGRFLNRDHSSIVQMLKEAKDDIEFRRLGHLYNITI